MQVRLMDVRHWALMAVRLLPQSPLNACFPCHNSARISCTRRELGMSGGALLPASTPLPSELSSEGWPLVVSDLKCSGTEAHLVECSYRFGLPCPSGMAMAVSCTREWAG